MCAKSIHPIPPQVTFSSFFRAVSDRKMKKDKEEQTLSTDQEIFRILRQAQEDVCTPSIPQPVG